MPAKRKKNEPTVIGPKDAAIVFTADGSLQLLLPHLPDEAPTPEHVKLAAATLFHLSDKKRRAKLLRELEQAVDRG